MNYGKIGFEAYVKAKQGVTYDGKKIPSWDEVGEDVKSGWEAAATAVQGISPTTVGDLITATLRAMQDSKPGDRSEADRLVQIAITDLQKVQAWWFAMVERKEPAT